MAWISLEISNCLQKKNYIHVGQSRISPNIFFICPPLMFLVLYFFFVFYFILFYLFFFCAQLIAILPIFLHLFNHKKIIFNFKSNIFSKIWKKFINFQLFRKLGSQATVPNCYLLYCNQYIRSRAVFLLKISFLKVGNIGTLREMARNAGLAVGFCVKNDMYRRPLPISSNRKLSPPLKKY
jgi:hypothetical protein